jgi:hypothetical protein
MSERGGICPSSEPVTGSRASSSSDQGPQVSDVTRLIAQWRQEAEDEWALACKVGDSMPRTCAHSLATGAVLRRCADQLTRVLDHEAPHEKDLTHVDSSNDSQVRATGGQNELASAHDDCGFSIYGPPALCTCGQCAGLSISEAAEKVKRIAALLPTAIAVLQKERFVFRRFPRDMEKEPPINEEERWEALAFSLYSDVACASTIADSVAYDLECALGALSPSVGEPEVVDVSTVSPSESAERAPSGDTETDS